MAGFELAASRRWLHDRVTETDEGIWVRLEPTDAGLSGGKLAAGLALAAVPALWAPSPGVWGSLLLGALVVGQSAIAAVSAWMDGVPGPLFVTETTLQLPTWPYSRRSVPLDGIERFELEPMRLGVVLTDGSRLRVRTGVRDVVRPSALVEALERARASGSVAGFTAPWNARSGLDAWIDDAADGIRFDLSPVLAPFPVGPLVLLGVCIGPLALLVPFAVALLVAFGLAFGVVLFARFHPDGPARGVQTAELAIERGMLRVVVGLPFRRSVTWSAPVSTMRDVWASGRALILASTDGTFRVPMHGRSSRTLEEVVVRIRTALDLDHEPREGAPVVEDKPDGGPWESPLAD